MLHRFGSASLIHGECVSVLARFNANRFDACVTDPPYELGFMGKTWDGSGIAFSVEFWREVLRVLKPGAHLVAFGGTRTYHRMTCAIEDAGFEIRDSLHWFYGTGFPKSLNVAKAIDQSRTEDLEPVRRVCRFVRSAMDARGVTSASLAPLFGGCHPRLIDHWAARDTDSQPSLPTDEQWARLRVLLELGPEMDSEVARLNARKGQRGDAYTTAPVLSVVDRGDRSQDTATSFLHGAGDHTIRESSATAAPWAGWGTGLKPAHEPIVLARKPLDGTVAANVLRWGTGALNIDACRIAAPDGVPQFVKRAESSVNALGDGLNGSNRTGETSTAGRWPANVLLDEGAAAELDEQSGQRGALAPVRGTEASPASQGIVTNARARVPGVFHGDSGGASRFFYVAKPSRAERDLGCDHLPVKSGGEATDREDGSAGTQNPRAGAGRTGGARNFHPTVKPVELMRYLVRLVTPPGGCVLDPFTGSGTTGIAALLERRPFVGFEREAEYVEIAKARLAGAWGNQVP